MSRDLRVGSLARSLQLSQEYSMDITYFASFCDLKVCAIEVMNPVNSLAYITLRYMHNKL